MSNLDQRLSLSEGDEKIFREVERKVMSAITAGDPRIAFDFGKRLVRKSMINGVAAAKLLWELNSKWDLFRAAAIDDNFEDVVFAEMGYAPATTRKYVRMWDQLFIDGSVPDDIRQALFGQPIKNLLLLGPSVSDDLLSEEELWEAAHAIDRNELRKILRDATGGRTSSKLALYGVLNMDNGDLSCYTSEGISKDVGFLNIHSDDPDVQKFTQKIVRKVGIQERN